jgi:hypothetical protein
MRVRVSYLVWAAVSFRVEAVGTYLELDALLLERADLLLVQDVALLVAVFDALLLVDELPGRNFRRRIFRQYLRWNRLLCNHRLNWGLWNHAGGIGRRRSRLRGARRWN